MSCPGQLKKEKGENIWRQTEMENGENIWPGRKEEQRRKARKIYYERKVMPDKYTHRISFLRKIC